VTASGLPPIYSLLGVPVIGELGDLTRVREFDGCEVCGRRPPPEFPFIEYRFDRWAGEDLVTAMGEYAASRRLRSALEKAALHGFDFRDMALSSDDAFEIVAPAYSDELPDFFHLVITGRADGPEKWWTGEICEACAQPAWRRTTVGRRAEMADIVGEVEVSREVYRDSWKGDDIFRLRDPGTPLVTQRFRDVLDEVGLEEILLYPARWVEDSRDSMSG
jgi:hypothetical protein